MLVLNKNNSLFRLFNNLRKHFDPTKACSGLQLLQYLFRSCVQCTSLIMIKVLEAIGFFAFAMNLCLEVGTAYV